MAPFTVQVRRLSTYHTSLPLHLCCSSTKYYDHGKAGAHAYSDAQMVLAPGGCIISMNGRAIPPEWLAASYEIGGNYMIVDGRWAITDFIMQEVY